MSIWSSTWWIEDADPSSDTLELASTSISPNSQILRVAIYDEEGRGGGEAYLTQSQAIAMRDAIDDIIRQAAK